MKGKHDVVSGVSKIIDEAQYTSKRLGVAIKIS